MVEYQIVQDFNASNFNQRVNELAKKGWMMSQFSVSNAKSQYGTSELFACIMEKETL